MAEQQNNNQNTTEQNFMNPSDAAEILSTVKNYVDNKSSTIDITYNGTTKTLDFAI